MVEECRRLQNQRDAKHHRNIELLSGVGGQQTEQSKQPRTINRKNITHERLMANKERNINNILSNKLVLFNTFFDTFVYPTVAAGTRSETLFNDPIRWSNVSFLLCVRQTQREDRNGTVSKWAQLLLTLQKFENE